MNDGGHHLESELLYDPIPLAPFLRCMHAPYRMFCGTWAYPGASTDLLDGFGERVTLARGQKHLRRQRDCAYPGSTIATVAFRQTVEI